MKRTRLTSSAALRHLFDGDVRGKFKGRVKACLVVGDGVRSNKGDAPNKGRQSFPDCRHVPTMDLSAPDNAAGQVLGAVEDGAGGLGDKAFVLSLDPCSDASFS